MSTEPITYETIMKMLHRMGKRMERSRKEYEQSRKEAEAAREQSRKEAEESHKKWEERVEQSRKEYEESRKALELQVQAANKKVEKLGGRISDLIEDMVRGGAVRLFQELGYEFTQCSRSVEFDNKKLNICGEIDLFLENGEYALLIEVKTNLSVDDVKDHVERLREYRLFADTRGDKRRFIAAAGGGVVRSNVRTFALKQGLFVIQQSGENIEVISPEGKPRVW